MRMPSRYHDNFTKNILDKSYSKVWDSAVREWIIVDVEEDEELESSCICGKENLKYLYTIKNSKNGESIYPIGSSCIKKFGNKDMDEYTKITEDLFRLLHTIKDKRYINLDSNYFSRKILKYLFDEGAFQPNQYNNYNGREDYNFMLQMFNKINKDDITPKQKKKINGIIIGSIRPFLEELIEEKITRR